MIFPKFSNQLRFIVSCAKKDFIFEWRVSLCLTLALAAVLAPLLVLFGLKSGIVDTMTTRLKTDPRNREIVWKLNSSLDQAWVTAFGHRRDVGFLVPNIRSLAATVDLVGPTGDRLQDVDMLPTAIGDPLLAPGQVVPSGFNEAALSEQAARRLGVSAGNTLSAMIVRNYRGQRQEMKLVLRVVSVVKESAFSGKVMIVPLPLLEACENYRDGYAIPELGLQEGSIDSSHQHRYSRLRLYARTLDDVAVLAEDLRASGIDVSTRSKDIELVKQIDHALTFLFQLIATVGFTGCLVSLAASIWANVERKRNELALLRLIGVRARLLAGFPMTQALLIAGGGILISFIIYNVLAVLINQTFQTDLGRDELVCRLQAQDGFIAVLLTLLLAILASLMGVLDVLKIDPAESLREL